MRHLAIVAVLLGSAVQAEEWTPMTGDDIRAALTDQKLQYEGAWQEFKASGRTLYHAGEPSWGYWRVQVDQYCSQWPPGGLWDCYTMERSGEVLRFVSEFGDITVAQVVK